MADYAKALTELKSIKPAFLEGRMQRMAAEFGKSVRQVDRDFYDKFGFWVGH